MNKYSRVSYEERCQIFALLETNCSRSKIATLLGRNKSTISRELNRNSFHRYNPVRAQRYASCRFSRCRKKTKVQGWLRDYVEEKLGKYWTPEQIAGRLFYEKGSSISHETIYRYVRKNRYLSRHLPYLHKTGFGRIDQRRKIKASGISILKRPDLINKRERVGDWERDGMYGANRQQLLVCTERKTRYTKLAVMATSHSDYVNELTIETLNQTETKILSITNDNGTEFRKPLKENIPVYFCTPMKPQQRGTVENTIGILRRRIKRNTNLIELGIDKIKEIEKEFNLIPRKILDYLSPFEVFFNTKVALVL